jgi:hypothetical protein
VPVKIIYGNEIFRIKIDKSFSKLQEVVSGLINKPRSAFTLSYHDQDGDRLVICSDEDLENAVTESPVLKIVCSVRERPASAPAKSGSVAGTLDTHTSTMTRLAAMHDLLKDRTKETVDDKLFIEFSSEVLEASLREEVRAREEEARSRAHALAITAERYQVHFPSL